MKIGVTIGIVLALLVAGGLVYWLSAPAAPSISISGAWVRSTPEQTTESGAMPMGTEMPAGTAEGMKMTGTSALYMTIENRGRAPDQLLKVESAVAGMIQIHQTGTKNGVTMMSAIPGVKIPARGKAVLKPGDLHVMLMELHQPLKAGETVNFTLYFEKSGAVTVQAEVRAP